MKKNDVRVRSAVGRWGNSAAVRLPAALMAQANLSAQQPIDLVVSAGRIVIEPVELQEFQLDQLLAGINSNNLHGDIDFGSPLGRELL